MSEWELSARQYNESLIEWHWHQFQTQRCAWSSSGSGGSSLRADWPAWAWWCSTCWSAHSGQRQGQDTGAEEEQEEQEQEQEQEEQWPRDTSHTRELFPSSWVSWAYELWQESFVNNFSRTELWMSVSALQLFREILWIPIVGIHRGGLKVFFESFFWSRSTNCALVFSLPL